MPLDMVNAAAEELEVSMDKYASEYVGGEVDKVGEESA